MHIIGIDPGITGAVGIIDSDGVFLGVHDTPVIAVPKFTKRKARHEYNLPAMARLLEPYANLAGTLIIIEEAQAMPGQGAVSTWSTGYGYGVWIGLIGALGLRHERIRAAKWKRAMGLSSDKEASRLLASQLFPSADLSLKRHHGRAEALLIARYGLSLYKPNMEVA